MKQLLAALILAATPLAAEEAMTLKRLTEIVQAIDPEARIAGTAMELTTPGIGAPTWLGLPISALGRDAVVDFTKRFGTRMMRG